MRNRALLQSIRLLRRHDARLSRSLAARVVGWLYCCVLSPDGLAISLRSTRLQPQWYRRLLLIATDMAPSPRPPCQECASTHLHKQQPVEWCVAPAFSSASAAACLCPRKFRLTEWVPPALLLQTWERFDSPYQAHFSTGLVATPQRSRNPRVAWGTEGYGQVPGTRNLGVESDWNWSYPAGQASSNNRGRAWQEVFSGFHAAADRR